MRGKSVSEYNNRRWGTKKLRSNIKNGEHLSKNFSELKDSIPKLTFFFFFMALRLSSRRKFFLVRLERKDSTSRWKSGRDKS